MLADYPAAKGRHVGNSASSILAAAGGIVEFLMHLDDSATSGQKISVQRNMFGEVVAEYASEVAGKVTRLRSNAMGEPGNPLAFILFDASQAEEPPAYPE